jgi:hypothetical protein
MLHEFESWQILPARVLKQAFRMILSRHCSSSSFVQYIVEETNARHGLGPVANCVLAMCLPVVHSETPLCRFYFWLQNARDCSSASRVDTGAWAGLESAKPLLPAHLPHPPEDVRRAPPTSGRPRANFFARRAAWHLTEWMVALFGFYECGGPKTPRHYQDRLGVYGTTQDQEGAILDLFEGNSKFCRLRVDEPLTRGRRTLAESLAQLQYYDVNKPVPIKPVGAKSVEVDRIAIPSEAGCCEPRLFLREPYLQVYENIEGLLLPPSEWDALPRPCLMISPSEEQKLRLRLVSSGMAVLLEEGRVPRTPGGRKILAGLFGVEHKISKDRLIFDRRPQNSTEGRLRWASLPHGAMLARLRLSEHEEIRGTVVDLSNYFYNLRSPPSWVPRNAFGRVFTGPAALELGGNPQKRYHLALRVWPMGDHNSVCLAQQVHEGVLQAGGAFHKSGWLRYGDQVPRDKLLQGVYIDDHLIAAFVDKRVPDDPALGPDAELLRRSLAAYARAKLPVAEDKGTRQAPVFTVWGTEVHSPSGIVGAPRSRRVQLMHLAFACLNAKTCSADTLRSMVGSVIHPFLHRREWNCVLGRIFRFIEKAPGSRTLALSPDIRDELRGCLLGMLACTSNIKARVSSNIFASDATPIAAASVVASVSEDLAQRLYDFGDHKGRYVRLDTAAEEAALSRWAGTELPEYLTDAVASARWMVRKVCHFRNSSHVNLQELRGLKFVLKDPFAFNRIPRRLACLSDSQVVIGAYAKGRSSSCKINSVLRGMLGWSQLRKLEIALCWVPSHQNIADEPSRDKPLKPPAPPTSELVRQLVMPGDAVDNPAGSPGSEPEEAFDFLECFAGRAELTRVAQAAGLRVGEPMEAFPQKDRYISEFDLSRGRVVCNLREQIRRRLYRYIHFGVPCTSWSIWQRMNPNSTRSTAQPAGEDPNEKELAANRLVETIVELCWEVEAAGGFWTIENPDTSLLWAFGPVSGLIAGKPSARFDQCMYGLEVGGARIRKSTRVVGNFETIQLLSAACSRDHPHRRCAGKVRTDHGWVNVSQLAGAYPADLCSRWIAAYLQTFCSRARTGRGALE